MYENLVKTSQNLIKVLRKLKLDVPADNLEKEVKKYLKKKGCEKEWEKQNRIE